MATPKEQLAKKLNHISSELNDVHHELTRARSVEEIKSCGQDIHKITSSVSFRSLVHDLGDSGHHLSSLLGKVSSNAHKATKVVQAKQCLVLLESAQHAVKEALHHAGHSSEHHSHHSHHSDN